MLLKRKNTIIQKNLYAKIINEYINANIISSLLFE